MKRLHNVFQAHTHRVKDHVKKHIVKYTFGMVALGIASTLLTLFLVNGNLMVSAQGVTCGNSIIEVDEFCDDGNVMTGDGCSDTCQVEWLNDYGIIQNMQSNLESLIASSQSGERLRAQFCLANLLSMQGQPAATDMMLDQIINEGFATVNTFPYIFYLGASLMISDPEATTYMNTIYAAWGYPSVIPPVSDDIALYRDMFLRGPVTVSGRTMQPLDDGIVYDSGIVPMCAPYYAYCGNGSIELGETCDDGSQNGLIGFCNASCNGATPAFSCGIITDISTGECEALVALYTSTSGENWTTGTNRLGSGDTTPSTACDRYGVECNNREYSCCVSSETMLCPEDPTNSASCQLSGGSMQMQCASEMGMPPNVHTSCTIATGRVEGLILNENNLSGDIPSAITGLSSLQNLSFSNNHIVGLPENLIEMIVLESLDPNYNYISTCTLSESLFSFVSNLAGRGWETTQTNTCPVCGDGIIGTGEVCDDGIDNGSAGMCNVRCTGIEYFPEIIYSPASDQGTTSGIVTATVSLPEGCSVLNNGGSSGYDFRYNGHFAFEVTCPRLEQSRMLFARVSWIGDDSVISVINSRDMKNESTYYFENKSTQLDTSNLPTESAKKMAFAKQTLVVRTGVTEQVNGNSHLTVRGKNIFFGNDSIVYEETRLESDSLNPTTERAVLSIPANTVLKTLSGEAEVNFTDIFYAPTKIIETGILANFAPNVESVDTVIHAGALDKTLLARTETGEASSFGLTIYTDEDAGEALDIYSSLDGTTWTYFARATVQTSDSGNYVLFDVPHLTYYGLGTPLNVSTPGPTGGGGGTILLPDYCAAQDCSSSYYDHSCGVCPTSGHYAPIEDELYEAYMYAFTHGITNLPIEKARLGEAITRRALAKMMVVFAQDIVNLSPNTGKICNYNDLNSETKENKLFIKQSCQLGLMGLEQDGITVKKSFNPNGYVTRAEFATIFSRLLFDGAYNIPLTNKTPRYSKHLLALQKAAIMSNISNPNAKELRGNIMIMMLRADKKQTILVRNQLDKVHASGGAESVTSKIIRQLLPF